MVFTFWITFVPPSDLEIIEPPPPPVKRRRRTKAKPDITANKTSGDDDAVA
jgi:hypothetical protein